MISHAIDLFLPVEYRSILKSLSIDLFQYIYYLPNLKVNSLSPLIGISNCGVQSWIQEPPKRAVTMNQGTTEVMLALGLEDSMVGTAYLDDYIWPAVEEAYNKIPVIGTSYPNITTLLSVDPDFIYASYSSAFATSHLNYSQFVDANRKANVIW